MCKLSDQLKMMSSAILVFLTPIFDGHLDIKCMPGFLDKIWLRGGGMTKHYFSKAVLPLNSKVLTARKNLGFSVWAVSSFPLSSQSRTVSRRLGGSVG